ncbi:MAG: NAD(P)H-dependent oxidoreductase [Acidobacteriota bacterium]|nr:NAD(P)H-dependent oxidoreductase [Acidobacteriota bacterium]
MSSHLVVSCSLREASRSAILARRLVDELRQDGRQVEEIDLRRLELPMCDDGECYHHPNVVELRAAIESAATVTIATPIYNFEVGGATRNLVAVSGNVWNGKIVGLLCAAGGAASYMAVMGLANSLMLDFCCLIVPRFVYGTRNSFDGDEITDDRLSQRLVELAGELERLATALAT